MDIICEKCQSKFVVPDNKIPKGQKVSVSCPKCKHPLTIESKSETPPPQKQKPQPAPAENASPQPGAEGGAYDAAENPFDFIEEGVDSALVCESDSAMRDKVRIVIEKMGYKYVTPQSPRDALKQMRFHDFNVIVINERFGTRDPDMNHVMKFLSQIPMSSRRNMFVILLTDRFRSNDAMMSYNKSVNIIVNLNNIDDFEKIIKKGISDFKTFYRIYKESLQKIGKG